MVHVCNSASTRDAINATFCVTTNAGVFRIHHRNSCVSTLEDYGLEAPLRHINSRNLVFTGWKSGRYCWKTCSAIYTVLNNYSSWSMIRLIRKFCDIHFPKYLLNQSTKSNCWNKNSCAQNIWNEVREPRIRSAHIPADLYFCGHWPTKIWIVCFHF